MAPRTALGRDAIGRRRKSVVQKVWLMDGGKKMVHNTYDINPYPTNVENMVSS